MLRFLHQCIKSRDLDRLHSSKYELHSLFLMRFDLHVILKRALNRFSSERILPLDVDLNAIGFCICCITETWKHGVEKHFMSPSNHKVYLLGRVPDSNK